MTREIVTSENKKEYDEKKLGVKEKTARAKVKEHISYWQKHGDLKDIKEEGSKGLSEAIHSHHRKGMKPHESKLAQISSYGKPFDAREYFKTEHANDMHKGGVLKQTGSTQHPDIFTDSGHSILKAYLSDKM